MWSVKCGFGLLAVTPCSSNVYTGCCGGYCFGGFAWDVSQAQEKATGAAGASETLSPRAQHEGKQRAQQNKERIALLEMN